MGFFDDIINGLNALTNLKKADAEQTKARTQKSKTRRMAKENREYKKVISRNKTIGIVGILVTIAGVFIGYYLLVYFPIHTP